MKWLKHACLFIPVLALLASGASHLRAQDADSKFRLRGFYLRGGYTSFSRALILNWNERELMLNQGKGMPSFGVGYALFPRNFWAGVNVSAQYARTTLDPFRMKKINDPNMPDFPTSTLQYSGINYSLLLFDFDTYLVPSKQVPFAFTLGFVLGGSFQGYSVSGDTEEMLNANGSKSMSMFRYGYKLGCKIMPFRRLSIDLEYRPMSAYTATTTYSDFLYTDGTWDYFGSASTKSGPSERMFSAALSFHF